MKRDILSTLKGDQLGKSWLYALHWDLEKKFIL